jgi:hypothetical protein
MERTAIGIVFAGAAVALLVFTILLPAGNDGASILFVFLALCFLLAAVLLLPSSKAKL